jgi:hypothetical protein
MTLQQALSDNPLEKHKAHHLHPKPVETILKTIALMKSRTSN